MDLLCKNHATLLKRLYILGVALLLLPFLLGYRVYVAKAATNPVITLPKCESAEVTQIKRAVNAINKEITGDNLLTDDTVSDAYIPPNYKFLTLTRVSGEKNTYDLEVDLGVYDDLGQNQKQRLMGYALDGIRESGISKLNRTKIYNFISNSDMATANLVRQLSADVSNDFAGAYASFKPFSGVFGWILGIFTLLTFAFLGVVIVVDLAYIVIPFFQDFLDTKSENAKPSFVSLEAWNAVKESEKDASRFREPLGLYFKLKTKQFLAMGLCILYLVSGKLYIFISDIMDILSGIVG